VLHCLLHFHVFMHLHLASHLGMLDAPREGRDVEPNPKMVFGRPIQEMEGLSKSRDGRCSPRECHLTNTNLRVGSQASPGAL
jgi:hypothetical protein